MTKAKRKSLIPYITPRYRAEKNASLSSILIGLVVVLFAFSPIVNQPQCEGMDTSGCIIGANIGMGLIIFAGLILIFIGIIGLGLLFLFTFIDKHKTNPRRLKLGIGLGLVIAILMLALIPMFFVASVDDESINEPVLESELLINE